MTTRKPRKDRRIDQIPLAFTNEIPTDEERDIAQRQADYADVLARKIENGDSLTKMDVMVASAVLRNAATRLRNLKPKGKRGAARKFDPGTAALDMACRLTDGRAQNKTDAWEQVAEAFGVTVEAMKRAKHMEDSAIALVKEGKQFR
ncbi:MAG: hypothetical protein R3F04_16370 [Lysobacteraceae bacterium]